MAAVGSVWTIDDLDADPRQELEDIKGAGPAADHPAVMSIYEFDEVTSVDAPMLFSMDSGVALAADEGETSEGTVLKLADLMPLFSPSVSSGAFLCEVYHPGTTVAGVTVPSWTEYRSYPDSGSSLSLEVGNSFFNFLTRAISVPDSLNGGEVVSFRGLVFPPFSSDYPIQNLGFDLDLSSFNAFSSFGLSGRLKVFSTYIRSGSLVNPVPCSLDLYVNGALVRSFDVESDGFIEFGSFEYDISSEITSIQFVFVPSEDFYLSYVSDFLIGSFSFVKDSTFELTIDMAEGTFRQEVTTGIGNIFQGILELPGKIVNLLIDGLKSLFIPSEDDMTSLTGKYQQLLSERLGFIWQAYELVSNFFTGIMDALESGGAYEFTFPGISFPFNDEELVILPETPVSLENEAMDVIRPVLGTIVCFIAVVGFINVAEGMVIALISGVSYYNFIRGKGGDSG